MYVCLYMYILYSVSSSVCVYIIYYNIIKNNIIFVMSCHCPCCGVLLLEPIPALSQGEGKSPAHRRALTDEQCGVQ